MSQFFSRDRKRRDSSRPKRLTRQDHATSPVTDKRVGWPPFQASQFEKTSARRARNIADGVGSEKTPDRRSGASQARKEAKDKSHIQCFICDQYDHHNTQCDQNSKVRKYLRRGNHSEQHTPTTTEGGGHEDPTPMGHMVDATITGAGGQKPPPPTKHHRQATLPIHHHPPSPSQPTAEGDSSPSPPAAACFITTRRRTANHHSPPLPSSTILAAILHLPQPRSITNYPSPPPLPTAASPRTTARRRAHHHRSSPYHRLPACTIAGCHQEEGEHHRCPTDPPPGERDITTLLFHFCRSPAPHRHH
ncbi:hypothetical protein Dimus_001889 [Dionaea muscipula]